MPELTAQEREHISSCQDCRTVAFLVEAGLPPSEGSEEGAPAEIAGAAASVRAPNGLADSVMSRVGAAGGAKGTAPTLSEVDRDDRSDDLGPHDSRLFQTLRILVPLAAAAVLIVMILPPTHETVTSRDATRTRMSKEVRPSEASPGGGFGDAATMAEGDEIGLTKDRGGAASAAAFSSYESRAKRQGQAPGDPLPATMPAAPKAVLEMARTGSYGYGGDGEALKEKAPKKTEALKTQDALPGAQTDEMPTETKPEDVYAKRRTGDPVAAEGEPEASIAEGGGTPTVREVIEEDLLDGAEDRDEGAARDERLRTEIAQAEPSDAGVMKGAGIGLDDGEATGEDLPDETGGSEDKALVREPTAGKLKQEEATDAPPASVSAPDAGGEEGEEEMSEESAEPDVAVDEAAGAGAGTGGAQRTEGAATPRPPAEDDDLGRVVGAEAGGKDLGRRGPGDGKEGEGLAAHHAEPPAGAIPPPLKEKEDASLLGAVAEGGAPGPGTNREPTKAEEVKKDVAPPGDEEAPRGPATAPRPSPEPAEGLLSRADEAKRELRSLDQEGGEKLEPEKVAKRPEPAATEATVTAAAGAGAMAPKGGPHRGGTGGVPSLDRLHAELGRLVKRYYPQATIEKQGDAIRFEYGAIGWKLEAEAKELKAGGRQELRAVEEVLEAKAAAPARGRIAGEMSLHRGTPKRTDKALTARKFGRGKVLDLVATSRKTETYLRLHLTYTKETPKALIKAIRELLEDPDRFLSE